MSRGVVSAMTDIMLRVANDQYLKPARILVVEDDKMQREVFRSSLARQGYEVDAAADGLDAVWKVQERCYDLVLLDYQLPEIDGLGAARLIRDLSGGAAARPLLIAITGSPGHLTGRDDPSGQTFDGVLTKPVTLAALTSGIEHHLAADRHRAVRRSAHSALLEQRWNEHIVALERPTMPDGSPMPACILVVEDDELQQFVLRSALESQGYAVQVASDGLKAVRMIRAGAFDLVLIDYLLPEMDGLAIGRLIVNLMPEDIRPRIIALTAATNQLDIRQAVTGSVFDEVLTKSSNFPDLLATVHRHLRSSPNRATRLAAGVAVPTVSPAPAGLPTLLEV